LVKDPKNPVGICLQCIFYLSDRLGFVKAMGDISGAMVQPVPVEVADLSEGWSFKQTDDVGGNSWSPVKKVPSTVHQDLIDNKK
jgi:hypothetical protein